MHFEGDQSDAFAEKPQTGEGWINGAFLSWSRPCMDYIEGDDDALGAHADGSN